MKAANIAEVENLQKWFILRGSFLDTLKGRKIFVKAVDGINFTIKKGETLALVGESGCGKTTVGRLILNLIPKTSGKIYFNGIDLDLLNKKDELQFHQEAQIILQDPYGSLNPRMRVSSLIGESIDIHGISKSKDEKEDMIIKSMETVNLIPIEDIINKFPNELSGGQMQRVAIARALVLNPKFIIADEPVSMLDASIQANILNLFISIRNKFDLSMLFITHDLAVARYISDRIAVMYLGKIVEFGSINETVSNPLHPYAQALFSAVRSPDPRVKVGEIKIKGDISDPIDLPSGCRFYPRCPLAEDICRRVEPELMKKDGQLVACHMV
jgi:peptide/nickel transport system ATP-binding protein